MAPRVDNLRESIHRAVRLVALGHLADAVSARDRLADSTDDEALHDFRVALRRLRTWERAFRPYLRDDLSKKLRRRLRDLARDTGASRDLEVHLAWLAEQRRSLGRRQRAGLAWLLSNLRERKEDADSVLEDDVDARFGRLETRLRRALGSYREKVRLRDDGRAVPLPPFAEALAPRVRDGASELHDHLARVQTAANERDGHEARISAKRLRYLLEPVAKSIQGVTEIVDRLKSLQDVLGDLHDAQVFGAEIASLASDAAIAVPPNVTEPRAVAAKTADVVASAPDPLAPDSTANASTMASAEFEAAPLTVPTPPRPIAAATPPPPPAPDPLPGIVAIGERLRDRAATAFAQFAAEWLGDKSAVFFRELDAVADTIANAARIGIEIERKYLLRFVPDEARDGQRLDIDQGYVPGEELHERIRRVSVRHASGRTDVHFYRTVKLGEGVARTEIEEETTEAIFQVLWPLTRGRRLRKRRFEVTADGHTWEIDEFKNRDLVLAEIELESEDDDVTFPEWLEPAVQREVTTEPEFQNINLAR
jgi:CHAD domain-containing protein/CYTH domain-containing protein